MPLRFLVALVFALLAATGRGGSAATQSGPGAARASAPKANTVSWLLPTHLPHGLRLRAATRSDLPDCPDLCGARTPTVPAADIEYRTAAVADPRSVRLTEGIAGQYVPYWRDRPLGRRTTHIGTRAVAIHKAGLAITANWREGPLTVFVDAIGVSERDVVTLIESMRPTAPEKFRDVRPAPPPVPCVDTATRLAPTRGPEGSQRFVLKAKSNGSCGPDVFLMVSYARPGQLLTLSFLPAQGQQCLGGRTIALAPNHAVHVTSEGPVGALPGMGGCVVVGTVTIQFSATGVDDATLLSVLESVRPLDEAGWANLVAAIATPPTTAASSKQ